MFAQTVGVSNTARYRSRTPKASLIPSVSASSLYEAAALGVAEFRRWEFADAVVGRVTRLTVAVEAPATTHDLPMAKLMAWL